MTCWIEVASNESSPLHRALCAAAAGAGFFAGYVMVAGVPGFPPTSATHWIAVLTCALLLVTLRGRKSRLLLARAATKSGGRNCQSNIIGAKPAQAAIA